MPSDKSTLRAELRQRLAALSPQQIADGSAAVAERVLQLNAWRDARVVMAFLSLPAEVQTRPIIDAAWAAGKQVLVPRVDWASRQMAAARIDDWATPLATNRFGLAEPTEGQGVDVATIDLVLAPGLGFDLSGGRLGRGGGYYDRFLSQAGFAGLRCGLAFSCQILDAVPREPGDVVMDLLVTETAAHAFTARGRPAVARPSRP